MCSALPPSSPPSSPQVLLTIIASGSVSDYADTSTLQNTIAQLASVDASFVTISVTAASVLITAIIAVPASTTASAVQADLSNSLATAETASNALGIPVESSPTISFATTTSLQSPPSSPTMTMTMTSEDGGALAIVAAAGGGGAVLLLSMLMAAYCMRKKKGTQERARGAAQLDPNTPAKKAMEQGGGAVDTRRAGEASMRVESGNIP